MAHAGENEGGFAETGFGFVGGIAGGAAGGFGAVRSKRSATRIRRRRRRAISRIRGEASRAAEFATQRGSTLGEQSEFLRSAFGSDSPFTQAIGKEIGAAQATSGLFSAGSAAAEQAALGQSFGTQEFRSTLLGGTEQVALGGERIRQGAIRSGLQGLAAGRGSNVFFGPNPVNIFNEGGGQFAQQLQSGTGISGARRGPRQNLLASININRTLVQRPGSLLNETFNRERQAEPGLTEDAFLRRMDPRAFEELAKKDEFDPQAILREEFRESFRRKSISSQKQLSFFKRRATASVLGNLRIEKLQGAAGDPSRLDAGTFDAEGNKITQRISPLGGSALGLTGLGREDIFGQPGTSARRGLARLGGLAGGTLSRRLGIS